jgi:hypothetical protein
MVDAGMSLGKQGRLPTEMHHILLAAKDSVEDHPPSSPVHWDLEPIKRTLSVVFSLLINIEQSLLFLLFLILKLPIFF